MKKLNFNIFIAVTCIFIFNSCSDIFEDDISEDTIQLISPPSGSEIESNFVQLFWQKLEGAEEYRVQLLDETQLIIKDTLVASNTYDLALTPGSYFWRVRGENSAYTTAYSFPSDFVMTSSEDLETQKVFLDAPSDQIYSISRDLVLKWQAVKAAETYTLEVLKTEGSSQTIQLFEEGLTTTSFNLTATVLSDDGSYTWRVKAINETSSTEFTTRQIFIDNQPPSVATLNGPNDESTVKLDDTVTFTWILPADSGEIQSDITSILEIATDETFATIVTTYEVDTDEKTHDFSTEGTYYWRVRLEDEAGNIGGNSTARSLTLEE